jgi:hypothetical protein
MGYKDLIDRMDGFEVGTAVVENNKGFLQRDNGELIELNSKDHIEVLNGDEYEGISLETLINTKTTEGWPGYAGLYCRIKRG